MNKFSQIISKENTPLYVFELQVLENRIKYLKSHLSQKVALCYAIKANPFIVEKVSNLVERLEICSPGEYHICNSLQLPPHQFVISGVNKEESFVDLLVMDEKSIGFYTAESIKQFRMLFDAAVKNNKRINILLRLTSGNQFGMNENDIQDIIKQYQNSPFINIKGLQYFSGTQKTSIKKMRREIEYVDNFLERIKTEFGFLFEELEFGPGLPVSYFPKEEYDEDSFLKEFSEIINGMRFEGDIILELGRSIAASCGTYFTQVMDTKHNHGENYAIVDGGMHQLVYYGQFMAMKHPEVQILTDCEGEQQDWNICGSLCTINDILVKKISIPNLKNGSILAFRNAGAYSMTEGVALFLSRDLPKIILLDGEDYQVVRNSFDTYVLNTPKIERRL